MKKIVSGILIASLLIGSPLTVFAEVTESTSSSVLESAPDTTASNTTVSEILPQASTTKTTDSTIKDAVKQSESVSSTEEKTESSSTESSASSTDNSVKTEKKTASVKKALTKAATQELSTDFLDRTKRFSENGFTKDLMQDVTDIQSWLNTYDIFSLNGAQIVNNTIMGSLAVINGGLTVKGTTLQVKDPNSNNATQSYGAIVYGGLETGMGGAINFSQVKNGIYTKDGSLEMNAATASTVSGTQDSDGKSKLKNFTEVLQDKNLNLSDFKQAIENQSQYLNEVDKIKMTITSTSGITITKPSSSTTGVYVYDLVLNNGNKLSEINFSNFDKAKDIIVVNIHGNSKDGNEAIDVSGGGSNTNGYNVIWNFPTTTKINISTQLKGKILAPSASTVTNQTPPNTGAFFQYGFGESNSLDFTAIESEENVDIPLGSSLPSDIKHYITKITTKEGNRYMRDPEPSQKFIDELQNVVVSYLGEDRKGINSSEIDTTKPGEVYYIQYKYGSGTATKIAETKLTIEDNKAIGSLTLSKIPNLNFKPIELGSVTKKLDLKGFQVSDSPAASKSNGTDEGIVQITDTRANGKWKLSLSLEGDNFKKLSNSNSDSNSDSIGGRLNLSLLEKTSKGSSVLTTADPISTLSDSGTKIYNVDVDSEKSFLEIDTNQIDTNRTKVGIYQGTLNWQLSDTVN